MRTLIMGPGHVERTLSRLACEVVERNRGLQGLVIFGIEHSGVVVAQALAGQLYAVGGERVAVHPLDVSSFRDTPVMQSEQVVDAQVVDITSRHVLLVDDVLFSGRTARSALDVIVHYGRPASIQLVVLVDRGHREVPIQPDYIGRTLQTKYRENVVVDVQTPAIAVYVEE